MDTGKFIGLLVFGVIGVIVLSAFVPIISETTKATDTFTNDGVFYMTDDPTDYTLEYKGTAGEIWVNGELLTTFADLPNSTWTLISTPEYMVRMQGSGSNYACWLTSTSGTNAYIGSNATESATIYLTDTTIQVGTSDPVNYSGEFRGIAKDGKYVMTATGGFVVSDTDTIIIGNGTTGVTHWYDAFYIIGTVNDIEVYTADTITVSNIQVNANKIPNYNGSAVTSITFTATDGTNTTDATYNRVIVPAEVTLEKTIHPDEALSTIIDLLPLIAGIGLFIILVGEFLYRRYL